MIIMKLVFFVYFLGFVKNACVAIVLLDSYRVDSSPTIPEDVWKSSPEMIASEGYPVENHYVITPDGYILNVHRIPHGNTGKKNNKVALFVHGLMLSSSDFILFGPGRSMGYILADEGYDVWLINTRGNTYSRNHTTLDPDIDAEFWNFSLHELGTIDVPATIDYIMSTTGTDGVYYIGYSQGSTIFFVMASTRPEYNAKIKVHISWAPTVYMGNVKSPILLTLASWKDMLESILKLFSVNEFLPRQGIGGKMIQKMCSTGIGISVCQNILHSICGWNPRQLNTSRIPLMMTHAPSGCSTNQVIHFLQMTLIGKFRQFDLGIDGNSEKYGTVHPPEYDLSKVTAPIYLFHSANDLITTMEDIETLHKGLSNGAVKLLMEDSLWNHMDFAFGIDASKIVYSKVTSIFNEH